MSNSSGSSFSRTSGSDRYYTPPVLRRNQKQQQRPLESDPVKPDSLTVSDEPALPGTAHSSNLDTLLDSLTPLVPARFSNEISQPRIMKGRKNSESNAGACFFLDDVWESFKEWSAYGVEMPLKANGGDTIKQYYVPYLSAVQLYSLRRLSECGSAESSTETSSAGSSDNEADKHASGGNLMKVSQRLSRLTLRDKTTLSSSSAENQNTPGQLVYEYFEEALPHFRPPFHDKVSILASEFPSLNKYRSCDISPSSWFSVAWYPIYRIPVGSTLRSFDASFLTFHNLSAHSRRKNQLQFHASSGVDGSVNIALPAFGFASYKLRDSILNPNEASEWQQLNALLKEADDWLEKLNVKHPDYQHFVSRK